MNTNATSEKESIDQDQDLDPRDVRALTEHTSVLSGFGASAAGEYEVVSQSGKQYHVDVLAGTCDCPDHRHRGNHCKHLRGVEFATGRREIPEWVDRDAINNTLGDHVDAAPVFAGDVESGREEIGTVTVDAKPARRVATDGGQVLEAGLQEESGEETADADGDSCDCEYFDVGALTCAECYIHDGIKEVPER